MHSSSCTVWIQHYPKGIHPPQSISFNENGLGACHSSSCCPSASPQLSTRPDGLAATSAAASMRSSPAAGADVLVPGWSTLVSAELLATQHTCSRRCCGACGDLRHCIKATLVDLRLHECLAAGLWQPSAVCVSIGFAVQVRMLMLCVIPHLLPAHC